MNKSTLLHIRDDARRWCPILMEHNFDLAYFEKAIEDRQFEVVADMIDAHPVHLDGLYHRTQNDRFDNGWIDYFGSTGVVTHVYPEPVARLKDFPNARHGMARSSESGDIIVTPNGAFVICRIGFYRLPDAVAVKLSPIIEDAQ
jgi:hypothetical protein